MITSRRAPATARVLLALVLTATSFIAAISVAPAAGAAVSPACAKANAGDLDLAVNPHPFYWFGGNLVAPGETYVFQFSEPVRPSSYRNDVFSSGPHYEGVTSGTTTYSATPFAASSDGLILTFIFDEPGYAVTIRCVPPLAISAFSAPIDANAVNVAKAGRTIPVTYRLTDADGNPFADPISFGRLTSVANGTCSTSSSDVVETYSGGSGLQYLGDGWWQFNWKTPKSYAGQCRTMTLSLRGASQSASFQFN